jgi:hypothetical protein
LAWLRRLSWFHRGKAVLIAGEPLPSKTE